MNHKPADNPNSYSRGRSGLVLLVTLVFLIVLSTLGYTLTSRVSIQRHRDQYAIDYQMARYGCDSAVKYAMTRLGEITTAKLVARPNEPDFSDLFALSQAEYEQLLDQLAEQQNLYQQAESVNDLLALFEADLPNQPNDFNNLTAQEGFYESEAVTIRGPYGPCWPFLVEPIEFEIGSAKVRIEIEDENAKYPIGWAILDEKDVDREAQAGFELFCEWMDFNDVEIESLKSQLEQIRKIKPFKLKFEPIKIVKRETTSSRVRTRRGSKRRTSRTRTVRTVIPASVHDTDFGRLFHSSLLENELLARPTIISEDREESALKYVSLWGSHKINVNTAPRHVLEAGFTFGGNAAELADEIIQRRRVKPFKDLKELKKALFRYSNSIDRCKQYITTSSDFFTIRVSAVSGTARVSAVIGVKKDGKKLNKIGIISS